MPISLRGSLCDTQHVVGDDFAGVLAAAQGGREEDFAVLWRDANPSLLRYLRVLAPESAEDIAAETWVQVVRGLPGSSATRRPGGPGCSPPPGGGCSTRPGRASAIRPSRSTGSAPPRCPPRPTPTSSPWRTSPPESAIALLSELPAHQAEVIMLRVIAGLDTEVVAEMLGEYSPARAPRPRPTAGCGSSRRCSPRNGATSRAGVTL